MRYLRKSTAITLQFGPFLDATDGVTAETALTPAFQIAKAGAAFAARNSATAVTHDADGFYRVELNATDTDTVGAMIVKSLTAGACPVWHEFTVLPQTQFDAFIAGTGTYAVDVTKWGGFAVAASPTAGYPAVTVKPGIGPGELSINDGVVGAAVRSIDDAAIDAVLDRPIAEPTAIFTWPASIRKVLAWIGALSRNKITQSDTTQTVRNDADSGTIASAAHSDDGTTGIRGEFS